jgi:hypothetical protein
MAIGSWFHGGNHLDIQSGKRYVTEIVARQIRFLRGPQ